MYKVKNISKNVRQFQDKYTGKMIQVKPNKSVFTKKLPKEDPSFEVEKINIEKKEKKDKLNTKEEINNGSNTNR